MKLKFIAAAVLVSMWTLAALSFVYVDTIFHAADVGQSDVLAY